MYERPINPPEAPEMDVTVTVHGYTRGTLKQITDVIGGDAHFVGEVDAEGYREFEATTIVEEAEDLYGAESVVIDEIYDNLETVIDTDNLIVLAKDPREEEDWDRDHDW